SAYGEEERLLVSKIKETIQQGLAKRRYRWYREQIKAQTLSYDEWIREKERQEWEEKELSGGQLKLATVPYDRCRADFSAGDYRQSDVLVFYAPDGSWSEKGLARIADFFAAHPGTVIAYGDEDEIDPRGVRSNPWLKPDWSPDTLISYFYFGGVFALRTESAQKLPWLGDEDPLRNLYDLALRAVELSGRAAHIDSVVLHRQKIEPWGQEERFADLKRAAYVRRGWPLTPSGKVSVVIPSKDNPRVLSTCIHSVLESGDYRDFEIIVVDNGSNAGNRARIERMQEMLQEKYRFVYHYEPMEFNFSRMCNIGASLATGDYILLLNDDIEITQEDWLERLLEKAALPHVGAVGAKLIYPGTEIIQHAGITNIHLGPAHKLQFRSDANEYYFLRNRLAFDVLGVTGACLLVKRSVYEQAGGLSEQLRVAFNDVEFCYHLHELGYYNVVRNDVTLTHHESLSRGADDSTEKLRRLHRELNLLYELHPSVYGRDPFYHRYLIKDVLDAEFYTGCRYDFDRRVERVAPERMEGWLEPVWHNQVLRIGVEYAGDLGRWNNTGAGSGDWMLQGWTWALQVDNSHYDFSLLLKPVEKGYQAPGASEEPLLADRGTVWRLPCTRQYRPDIDENLHGITNTGLPGVCVCFDRDSLPKGDYLIGFLWEDTCSRQKLYRFSPEILSVE
ncbi:MAG: glycosyltransferase, partial [Eubacteriales bacterium]|nr:glycosyltransferase [Eubacteriales bacterium]